MVVVCTGGQLWSFENNDWGQVDTGDVDNARRSPHLVGSFPPDERVAQAAQPAGLGHSLVLLASEAVYSWGRGDSEQLGHGDGERRLLPRRIEELVGEKVVRVDANR